MVDATLDAPRGKLKWIDPTVAGFGLVHERMGFLEAITQGALCQTGGQSPLPQHGAKLPIARSVLGSCSH